MTTMSEAVGKVARLLGITKRSQQPNGHDAADLLDYLQGVIDRLPLLRNGHWVDVVLTSDDAYEARDGDRIAINGFNPIITLPTTYLDDENNVKIMRDLSRVHVIDDGIYVWSSTLAAWNKTNDLALTATFPFGEEDLPGIVAIAAVEAAPEYTDQPLSPTIMQRAALATNNLRGRFWREEYVREPIGQHRSDYAA